MNNLTTKSVSQQQNSSVTDKIMKLQLFSLMAMLAVLSYSVFAFYPLTNFDYHTAPIQQTATRLLLWWYSLESLVSFVAIVAFVLLIWCLLIRLRSRNRIDFLFWMNVLLVPPTMLATRFHIFFTFLFINFLLGHLD